MKTKYLRKASALLLTCILASSTLFANGSTEEISQGISGLIEEGAEVQLVQGGFEFIEGPVSDTDGTFYFTDIDAEKIYRMDLDENFTVIREPSNHANGMSLDLDGNLLICEHTGQRIARMDRNGNVTTVVDSYNGKRLNSPNDLWVHPDGSIYFTDPRYRLPEGPKPQPSHYVFRLAPDKTTLFPVIGALPKPNGIIGTEDGKKLYISDTETVQVYVYDINNDGTLSNAQLLYKGFSDGMALDEYGNIYLSSEEGVTILNSQGDVLEFIPTPERPANVAFGGVDGKTLYIPARTGLYSIRMNVTASR